MNCLTGIGLRARWRVILLVLVLASNGTGLPLHAVTRTWSGGLTDFLWSDPDNWNPSGVPQNGDDLKFNGFAGGMIINNLTNLTVRSLDFEEGSWELSGNTLGVTLSIANSRDGLVEIHCGIRLEGPSVLQALSGYPSDSSDLHLTGAIDLNGFNLTLLARKDGTVVLSGPISGSGQIRIAAENLDYFGSAGTVKFSGSDANTFTGGVTLSSKRDSFGWVIGAILVLDKQSTLAIPGTLTIATNATVKLDRPHQIADTASVNLSPAGQLLLQGNTETIANLSLVGARVTLPGGSDIGDPLVDTGGATLSIQENIAADNRYINSPPTIKGKLGLPPGTHVITTSGNQFYGLNIEGQILGDGGFTKSGLAALALHGSNIFNGDLTVAEGSVVARHPNALGSMAGFTLLTNAGSLSLDNVAIYGESLIVRGNSSAFSPDTAGSGLFAFGTNIWGGPVILDTNLVVGLNTVNFNGLISGPGLLHCASSNVELSGPDANTFTGALLVRNSLLLLNKSSGVAAFAGPLVVGGGTEPLCEARWAQDYQRLYANVTIFANGFVNLNNHRDDFGPVTFNGGRISTGTGELGIYGLVLVNFEQTGTIDGRIGLPSGYHEFNVEFNSTTSAGLQLNASIAGPGHLRKTGLGRLGLSASNTYTGLTVVDEGTLIVTDPAGLGSVNTDTLVGCD